MWSQLWPLWTWNKKSYEKFWSKSSVTWMRWRASSSSSCIEQSQNMIKYVHGNKDLGCAETRVTQWEKMKKKSMQRLMPNEDILNHICLRANYPAYCQKNFQLSRHLSPIGNDWGTIAGKCLPVRNLHCQPVYRLRVHRVRKTTVTVMILITALKQTQQNLEMMINCF